MNKENYIPYTCTTSGLPIKFMGKITPVNCNFNSFYLFQ